MRSAVLAVLMLLGANSVIAQSGSPSPAGPFSLGLQAGISYSGWNLALVGNYHAEPFSAYLGPSISLNRGLPGDGPMGLTAGLNYHIPSRLSWLSSLANIDYQLNFFPGGDRIQEFHLSYGLVFHVNEEFYIVQQLGYGFFLESARQVLSDERKNFSGYDGLLRLRAGYFF